MAKATKAKKSAKKNKSLLIAASVGQVLVVALAIAIISVSRDPHSNVSAGAYKDQLRGQVDTSIGSPVSGRDPASQQQTSLLDVASKPTGTGKQKTSSSTTTKTSTSTTNTAVAQDGLGANGCYVDYGIQGQECLPAHASSGGTLTCDGVRNHYSVNGIKVTGTDRYHLDTNHDGIACNAGD